MAWEIHKPHHGRSSRAQEIQEMLSILDADHTLAANIDCIPPTVYTYAKKLGYKVYVHDNKDGTSTVQIYDE